MSDEPLTDDELIHLREYWDHANSELDDDASDAWEVMCAKAGNDLLRLLNTVAAAREHAAISIARAASDGLAKEAAEAEVARLREKCHYAELSDDAHAAVRRLLMAHDVPMAAFIDDHVGNAIAQRDAARQRGDKYFEKLLTTTVVLTDTTAQRDAARAEADGLAEVLRGIQGMAEEELRTEELRPSTIMWQIEADARAALSARAQPPAKTAGTGAT